MSDLTAEGRSHLSASQFGIPSKAKNADDRKKSGNYPIEDRGHAQAALARVAEYGSESEKKQVRSRVAKKYPGLES